MGNIYIYGLVNPKTGRTRYVGKTIDPELRMQQHHTTCTSPARQDWLESLQAQGLAPEIKILEVLDDSADWRNHEIYWIREMLNRGEDLLNQKVDMFRARGVQNDAKLQVGITSEIFLAVRLACIERDFDIADVVRAAVTAFLDRDIVDFGSDDELRAWQDAYLEFAARQQRGGEEG